MAKHALRVLLYLLLTLACATWAFSKEHATKHTAAADQAKTDDPVCSTPGTGDKSGLDRPLALVGGEPILMKDLAGAIAAQEYKLRQEEYKLQSQALEAAIRQKVVEIEAKKQGLSVEELYKKDVDSKIAEVSDDQAKGYYLAAKNQSTLTFDEIKGQIKQILRNMETQQARSDYADSLRAKTEVAVLLQPPNVDINNDPGRVRGNPQAPVTVVEFSDFQCPFCKQAEATLAGLLAKYNGQVKLAYHDFPMRSLHPQAQMAAEASRCAEEQGKFWEFHDALLADQAKLDQSGLEATAQKLGLDTQSFTACLSAGKFKPEIDKDVQQGVQAGVGGTPAFFINGEFLSGSQPEAEFTKIIDRQLSAVHAAAGARASR